MNAPIIPITATTPRCFGVCCPKHYACGRYAAVEDPDDDFAAPIDTCIDGSGAFPLFLPTATPDAGAAFAAV